MVSMTWPDDLLTLDDWDALPEDVSRHFELVDGVLQTAPRPSSPHQRAILRLGGQMDAALTAHSYAVVPEVDVVLVDSFPPLVRAPDLVVVSLADARTGPKRYRGSQIEVAIELVSPGSARVDRVAKLAEYAEAGIPHYWIIDIAGPVSLDAYVLDQGAYRAGATGATGRVPLERPAPLTIDLDALLP